MLVELFHEELLMQIENMVGKAVKIDQITLSVTRGRFARICVQIDIQKPLVSFIQPLGYLKKIEYEARPGSRFELLGNLEEETEGDNIAQVIVNKIQAIRGPESYTIYSCPTHSQKHTKERE